METRELKRSTRVAILIAEALLVLVIVALLVAFWIPAWIGGRPGVSHMQ